MDIHHCKKERATSDDLEATQFFSASLDFEERLFLIFVCLACEAYVSGSNLSYTRFASFATLATH
jgi:predicted nucleic-acid-binding Zn-ribbon protein